MKTSFLALILFFIISSCNTKDEDYLFEDKLLDCFESEYSEYKLDNIIKDLEKIYIKHGLLKDKSSESKMIFFSRNE